MRVLVLGGNGMLGHKLTQVLASDFETWVTLRGSFRTYERFGIFDTNKAVTAVDAQNFDSIVAAVLRSRPQVVVNCIGVIKQLAAANDPIVTLIVNSLLPHRLYRLCQPAGIRVIHISTDCIFSGTRGMYSEEDESDAIDQYGRTKYLGEISGEGALTLRTSIIGRELESTTGLVEWFLSNTGGRVLGYRQAIYSGLSTLVLSRVIRFLIVEHPELSGILHVSSNPISKYEALQLIRQTYRVDVQIDPDDEVRIDRSLDSAKFRHMTAFTPPSWSAMIEEMAADRTPYDQWRKHK